MAQSKLPRKSCPSKSRGISRQTDHASNRDALGSNGGDLERVLSNRFWKTEYWNIHLSTRLALVSITTCCLLYHCCHCVTHVWNVAWKVKSLHITPDVSVHRNIAYTFLIKLTMSSGIALPKTLFSYSMACSLLVLNLR